MTNEQLLIFAMAAETLNFSETGRRLYLSQPTISQQIKALETEYDALLFERGKQLKLTHAGTVLYPFAIRIRQEMDAAAQALKSLKGTVAGALKLGASTTIGNCWLPKILTGIKRRYPLVEPSLVIENSANLLEQLCRGNLHLLMVEGTRPSLEDDRFQIETFFEDRLVLVASPGLPLPDPMRLQDLCELPWILRERGSGTRDVLMNYLSERKLLPINTLLELGSTEAIKHTVRMGEGIACISSLAVQEELAAGTLRQIEVDGWDIRRPLWMVRPIERYLSPTGRVFIDSLPR